MTTLAEYQRGATWRLCIYGRPKVGKTALAGQLAKIFRLHWFDLEDGIKTLLKPELLAPELRSNILHYPMQSSQVNPIAVETLLKVTKGTPCIICYKHGKVECFECKKVPNSVTNRICLNEFTVDDMLVIDSTTQLSIDANFATNPIIRAAQIPEDFVLGRETGGKDFKYPMAVAFVLDRIFGTIQALKINCAVVSHETMTERTQDTGKVLGKGEAPPGDKVEMLFPSCGSRNFTRSFGKYFDAIIHLDIMNRRHVAYSSTVHAMDKQTGSRMPYNIEDMKDSEGKVMDPKEAIVEIFRRTRLVTSVKA